MSPEERLPIWSVIQPNVATTGTALQSATLAEMRMVSGKKKIRFSEVIVGFVSWWSLFKVTFKIKYYNHLLIS